MFGRRSQISIILVTDREVVRYDVGRDPARPSFQLRMNVDAESNLAQAVGMVVNGHKRLGTKTIVAATGIWSQVILLPQKSVQDVSTDELREALKFEAETLSGFEIDDISLAFLNLGSTGDQQRFWVSVVSNSELQTLNEILEKNGCRNNSFVHPAGLTRINSNANQPSRLELWAGQSYFFESGKQILRRVQQSNNLVEVESNENDVASAEQIIVGPDVKSLPENLAEKPSFNLAYEIELDRWFSQVAVVGQHPEPFNVPTIHFLKRTPGTPVRHLVSVLLALAILSFCFWHWSIIAERNSQLAKEIQHLQQPGIEKKKHDSQLIAILENRTKAELEAAETGRELQRIQFFIDHQSDRFAKLLDLVVELRTPDLVIEKLSGSEEGVVISGVSLNGESAQAFAKKLREISVEMGWVVNPAKQEGQQKLTSGGPWDFHILLSDSGPFDNKGIPNSRMGGIQNN